MRERDRLCCEAVLAELVAEYRWPRIRVLAKKQGRGLGRVRIRSKNSCPGRSRLSRAALVAALGLVLAASISHAQETLEVPIDTVPSTSDEAPGTPDEGPDEPDADPSIEPGASPDVGLDQLLRLPNSLDFKEERRGGGGAADWRRRFNESRQDLAEANQKLEDAETAMGEAATAGSGQWQIAPPGQQANSENNGPLSFKLREELRRARADLESAERRHRALVVEADLAEVPEHWRQATVH